ncbi:hypothetical protein FQN57_002964 [Myotisia sp. PD_48]|nr:hypothetical protein FQN57_002964 [Myotisia sp. PD_48]
MPPRLTVHKPSPTTCQFTVSNASTRLTVASKFFFCVEIILRISVAAAVLLVNAANIRSFLFQWGGSIPWVKLWGSKVGMLACSAADNHIWPVIATCSGLLLYLALRKGYTEESLLVIRGLGIQTSTSSRTYFLGAETRFIPTTQIQDIVIHEAFRGFEVKFYLAIIVDGESDVVVAFPNLLPRRAILEEVWKGARKCLYDPALC